MSLRKKNRVKARRKVFSDERYRQYRDKQNRVSRKKRREEMLDDFAEEGSGEGFEALYGND